MSYKYVYIIIQCRFYKMKKYNLGHLQEDFFLIEGHKHFLASGTRQGVNVRLYF